MKQTKLKVINGVLGCILSIILAVKHPDFIFGAISFFIASFFDVIED